MSRKRIRCMVSIDAEEVETQHQPQVTQQQSQPQTQRFQQQSQSQPQATHNEIRTKNSQPKRTRALHYDDEVLNKTCVADDANFETMPTTNSLDDVHTTTPVVGAAIHLIAEQTNNLVKLLDLDDEVVAYALLKSKDPTKEVQGRPLGDKWSEVLVRLSTKDDAPLMRIDAGRRTIKDAAAATQTIAWRNDFIKSDFRPH